MLQLTDKMQHLFHPHIYRQIKQTLEMRRKTHTIIATLEAGVLKPVTPED